jgi:hypothetical protein
MSLCLFLLDPCGFLERGQRVLLLLEGGLRVPDGHFILLEGFALLLKGPGGCGDGRLLTLELSLLALELGLLALELGLLLLERRPSSLQLSSLCLGLLIFLFHRGALGVALAGGPRQLLL